MNASRGHAVLVGAVVVGLAVVRTALFAADPDPIGLGESRSRGVIVGVVADIGRQSPGGWTFGVDLTRLDDKSFSNPPRLRLFVPRGQLEAVGGHGASAPMLPGDRLEVFGRLERYPPAAFPRLRGSRKIMAGRGVDARAIAVEPPLISPRPVGPWVWLERRLAESRAAFVGRLRDRLSGQKAALAVALTTGNRSFVDPRVAAPFRRTGTAHLLAISGLHLGVLAAMLWWLCGAMVNRCPWLLRRFNRRRVCGAWVAAALGCYVVAIGAPVSAVRAWVAIAFGVAAVVVVRPVCPFHALGAAAVALIWASPAVVFELGFQLSFAATAAILLFLRFRPPLLIAPHRPLAAPEHAWRRWATRWARRAGLLVGVSTSATLATWPIVAAHFGRIAPCGLVVNVVVTPLVSALVFPVLLAGALLAVIVGPLIDAQAAGVIAAVGVGLLAASTQALSSLGELLADFARQPGAVWVTGATPLWATGALAIGALVAVTSRWRLPAAAAAAVLIAIGLSPGLAGVEQPDGGHLQVHFIPVGQGDATLVVFPDATTMLIDGGGRRLGRDPGRFVVVPYLHRLGIDRLDWMVATHADTDHLGGLFAVVDIMGPRHFVFDAHETAVTMVRLRDAAEGAGAELNPVDTDIQRDIGGVGVQVTRPRSRSRVRNDDSLVTRLTYRPAAVVLPGDIQQAAERWVVAHKPLRATILKVPHHGSKTSSSRRFIDAVDPTLAVVSAGRFSRFGHPHPRVVARYRRRKIAFLQTAFNGLVRVDIADSGTINVRVFRR